MKVLFTALAVLVSTAMFSQSVLGKWKTIDDETGKAKSVIEIYKKGDLYFGRVIEIIHQPGDPENPICHKCDEDDPRYKQPIKGMDLIQNMEYDADDKELSEGEIMDPEKGETYDCKIWVGDDGKLNVRGYVAFFFRTQVWEPYTG